MNKRELIEKYKAQLKDRTPFGELVSHDLIVSHFLDDLKQLNEPQKPVVPQFVGDFIAEQKKLGHMLSYSIDACMSDGVAEWYWDNSELFARAWLDGYTVEKEKRYTVKIKAVDQYLVSVKDEKFLGFLQSKLRSKFTKKELEDASFGWIFYCPGVEIEEVE